MVFGLGPAFFMALRHTLCSVCSDGMDRSTDPSMWLPAVALCASLHLACFSALIRWQPHPLSFVSVAFGVMGLSCSLLVLLPGLRRVLQRKATAINAASHTREQWAEASPQGKPSHDVPDFRSRSVSSTGSIHVLCNALEDTVQEDAAAHEPAPKCRARPGLGALCATSAFIATDFLWAACGVHSFWLLTTLSRKAVQRLLFCVVALLPSILCVAMRAFGLSVFPHALHPVELCVFQGGNAILPIFMLLLGLYPQSESRVQKRGRRASRHIPNSESTLGMVLIVVIVRQLGGRLFQLLSAEADPCEAAEASAVQRRESDRSRGVRGGVPGHVPQHWGTDLHQAAGAWL